MLQYDTPVDRKICRAFFRASRPPLFNHPVLLSGRPFLDEGRPRISRSFAAPRVGSQVGGWVGVGRRRPLCAIPAAATPRYGRSYPGLASRAQNLIEREGRSREEPVYWHTFYLRYLFRSLCGTCYCWSCTSIDAVRVH